MKNGETCYDYCYGTTNDMTYIQYDLWYNKSCRMIIFTLSKYAGYILMLLYSEIMLRLYNLQIKFTFQEHHLLSIFPLFLFLSLFLLLEGNVLHKLKYLHSNMFSLTHNFQ